jgi:hypothetical protein
MGRELVEVGVGNREGVVGRWRDGWGHGREGWRSRRSKGWKRPRFVKSRSSFDNNAFDALHPLREKNVQKTSALDAKM